MSISSEITRLQGAKADLKNRIESVLNASIPSSEKLDKYKNYITPPAGCYITKPTANGIYIKYVGGRYSDYNVLWYNQTPVGVAVISSATSFVLHPSESNSLQWCTYNSARINGINSYQYPSDAALDYAGLQNTNAALASGYSVPAFTWARSCTYADNSQGYLPACGQALLVIENFTNINTALGLIGGTKLVTRSAQYSYAVCWTSTQVSVNTTDAFFVSTHDVYTGNPPAKTTGSSKLAGMPVRSVANI